VVEFRDSPLRPPIGHRDTAELLEDLCLALRNVAVREDRLPNGEGARETVQEVVELAAELDRRGVKSKTRLDRLSQETGWQMNELLADCRSYPNVIPWVRESDGIRRCFRCAYCKQAERPEDDVRYRACNRCLEQIIRSFDSLRSVVGTVLFRTFSADWRCKHADSETVLVGVDQYEELLLGPGECVICVKELLKAREDAS